MTTLVVWIFDETRARWIIKLQHSRYIWLETQNIHRVELLDFSRKGIVQIYAEASTMDRSYDEQLVVTQMQKNIRIVDRQIWMLTVVDER